MHETIPVWAVRLRVLSPLILAWLALPAGCAPTAELRLLQPQLAGRQQSVQLHSEHVFWSPQEQVDRFLIEIPLPGASTGRPTFLLYLRVPCGIVEPALCTATAPAEAGISQRDDSAPTGTPIAHQPASPAAKPMARGFLIQTRGDYAGLALVTGGIIGVKGKSASPEATRELHVDLTFEDGSRITGYATARRDDWYIKKFETRERPADVRIVTER